VAVPSQGPRGDQLRCIDNRRHRPFSIYSESSGHEPCAGEPAHATRGVASAVPPHRAVRRQPNSRGW
jgi:hypothetical protein